MMVAESTQFDPSAMVQVVEAAMGRTYDEGEDIR